MQKIKPFLTFRWLLPIAGLLIGLVLIISVALALRPHTFSGTLLQSPGPAYNFALPGPDDKTVSLETLRGKVVLLYFGYTTCPDVCPTTMRTVGKTLDLLGNRASQVQPVFITVDPERDTVRRLNAYLKNVEPRALGLSGDLETTSRIATQYGVYFEKRPYGGAGGYLVDHTATLMLVDQNGYLRLLYPFDADGSSAPGMASDIEYILAH